MAACCCTDLQVNEKDVEIVHTFNPSSQEIDEYCYPKPGRKNASSTLKLIEFRYSENGDVSMHTYSIEQKHPL